MSAGFQAILSDLMDASNTFHRESDTYDKVMPKGGPSRADAGDNSVNGILGDVLDAIEILHQAIAADIDDHAVKLMTAHDNYQRSEVSARELFDDIIDPDNVHTGGGMS